MNSTTDENSSSNSSNEDLYYNYYCCDPADLHYSYPDDSKASTAVNHGTVLDSSLVVRDVDVEEYVQHVYGISQADLAYIHSKEWELEGLSAYTEQLDTGEKQDVLCEPFKNIMGNLFKTLVKDGRKLDIHYVSLGTKGREGGNPDQSFFFGSHVDKMPVTWSLSKAFVEFVMTPKSQRLREFELSRKTGALGEEGTATAGSALNASIPDLLASPASTPSGTKRRHNSESYEPAPSAKRPRLGPLAGAAVEAPHAARYARELIASTCRRWATGVVVIDMQVCLHYYDRVGAIFTAPFSFDEEPWKLALFALAIGQCDLVQAGFEPLVAADVDAPLLRPLSSLNHAVLKLPEVNNGEGGQDGVEYAGDIGLGVWSHFEVTGDPLYVYGGLAGRGSHILPGKLIRTINQETEHDAAEVAGDKAERAIPASSEMVVKLSWPATNRPCLEATAINELVEKLPWVARYLPRVHCAITLKGESIGLPRHLFRDMTVAYGLEQRYFTLLFTDRYRHLWEVKTLADFQVVYLDIVECHYTTTRYGKILHRDISENNLLWSSADGDVTGVLNDWDLATPLDAAGKSTNHRTGTGPFMALDLLKPVPPVHIYRHDLESLFYVLIWAAVHYDIGSGVPHDVHVVDKELENWVGSYDVAHKDKRAFLLEPAPVLDCIKAAWQPVRKTWLQPLCDLFLKARINANRLSALQTNASNAVEIEEPTTEMDLLAMRRWDEDQDDDESLTSPPPVHQPVAPTPAPPRDDIDFETLGGCLTFQNFMAALNGSEPVGIPEEYEEYAKSLLREPKQVDVGGST